MAKTEVLNLWTTKVLIKRHVGDVFLNEMLKRIIMSYHSALGTFSTENHILWDWPYPEVQKVKDLMIEGYQEWAALYGHELNLKEDPLCDEYIKHSWVRIHSGGSRLRPHAHLMSDATAVYYVTGKGGDVKSYDGEGQIEIYDPRWVSDQMLYLDQKMQVEGQGGNRAALGLMPEAGMLLIFPGYLWHSVPAVPGPDPRISLVSSFEYTKIQDHGLFNVSFADAEKVRAQSAASCSVPVIKDRP